MKQIFSFLSAVALTIGMAACANPKVETLNPKDFETTINGQNVALYTLTNANGMMVQITNFGAKIAAIFVPDRSGNFGDVVTGYTNIQGYINSKEPYFGACIGRYGNRIANGQFTLNGKKYQLPQNDGNNHLHGGPEGFYSKVWTVEETTPASLHLSYLSKDGEAGYPGNLKVNLFYNLTDQNELRIEYQAVCDVPTHVNLTNHSFFNLSGENAETINNHEMQIFASKITPVDETLIPTGRLMDVKNTPFDFTKPFIIGARLHNQHEQMLFGKGYDHNFVLNNQNSDVIAQAAEVYDPVSGRVLKVFTNEPGIQFYGGNFLNGSEPTKAWAKGDQTGAANYGYRSSFCLETQHFPDTPNQPGFPSTLLKPTDEYHSICIYQFDVR